MPRKPFDYIVASQVCLYVLLALCICLLPHFLFERDEGGVSNYAVHIRTVVPYSLAFGVSSLCLIRADMLTVADSPLRRRFRQLLYGLAGLLLAVLASSYGYQHGGRAHSLHIIAAALLALFQLTAALWLGFAVIRNKLSIILVGLQLLAFALAALTFTGVLHILLSVQIASGVIFGLLLIRSARMVYPA